MSDDQLVVCLKSKMGELEALKHLEQDFGNVTVMVELLDSVSDGGKLLFPRLVDAVKRSFQLGKTLWIDTSRLTGNSPLSHHAGGPLQFVDSRLEDELIKEFGLYSTEMPPFTPVVPDAASDDLLATVRSLITHQHREVVVRLHEPTLSPEEQLRRLERIRRATRIETTHLHVVIDVGYLEHTTPELVTQVTTIASKISTALAPRTVSVLAGSVPRSRVHFTTHLRERPEVTLWQDVCAQSRDVAVHYGDYGVAHPVPSLETGSQPRPPYPYLSYTVPHRTIELRRKPKDPADASDSSSANDAFIDIAEELTGREEFAGEHYSWGDQELIRCGTRRPGNGYGIASKWVALATSHHIGHLARRPAAER
ncbi:hypothetical protein JOF53_002195 [Crossiella equi]|uniref:T4 beta protein n=1 Tax=Crossiella equi TaxID=130796 RepID=A0ABS5A9R7_9PSEU|nr:hypothetical protein [Crossiella equi]MBP2473323.1 hypothetical protein [Crossiella equi]